MSSPGIRDGGLRAYRDDRRRRALARTPFLYAAPAVVSRETTLAKMPQGGILLGKCLEKKDLHKNSCDLEDF